MAKVQFTDFSGGWRPDIAESEIPLTASNRLYNAYTRNGRMTGLYGLDDYLPAGLPDGLEIKKTRQFQFTLPSTKKIYIVHGIENSVDVLYVYPYLASDGTWTDEWQELTEYEDATMDSDVANGVGRFIKSASLTSDVDDYYKNWIFLDETVGYTSYVKAYVASTKTLELYNDVKADPFYAFSVWRNPIFAVKGVGVAPTFSLSKVRMFVVPDQIEFVYYNNSVKILCGHDNVYDRGPDNDDSMVQSDFILKAIIDDNKFNNVDEFSYTGLYLSKKNIDPIVSKTNTGDVLVTFAIASPETDSLPESIFTFLLAYKYDGEYETPLFVGSKPPYDGTRYDSLAANGYTKATTGTDNVIQLAIKLFTRKYTDNPNFHDLPGIRYKNGDKSTFYHDEPIFSRRITHLVLYVAETSIIPSVATTVGPISSFLKFAEIDINNSTWTPSGASEDGWYTIAWNLFGSDWTAAQGVTNLVTQGHVSSQVFGNANFGGVSSDIFVYAGVRQESLRSDSLIFTPTPSGGVGTNQSDILPHAFSSLYLDTYGISEIIACVFTDTRAIVFGSDKIAIINPETQGVVRVFEERGPINRKAVLSKNGLVYFAAEEDIYLIHPDQLVIRSIAMAQVRDYWRETISSADKALAAMGYDRFNEMLALSAGSNIFLYSIPRVLASAEMSDIQAYGTWGQYVVSESMLDFFTDVAGKLVGITDGGEVKRLFETESVDCVMRSKVFDGSFFVGSAIIEYTAPSAVTLKAYDLAKSQTYAMRTFSFPKATKFRGNNFSFEDAQIERLMFEITFPSGAIINRFEVDLKNIGLE